MKLHVSVKLFATLGSYTPEEFDHYPVAPGSSVTDLLVRLNVPPEEVKIIFINSRKAELSTPLQDGDRVGIFPAIGGG